MDSDDETALRGRFLGEIEQVRVALVADGHDANTEKLSGSCAKGDIGTSEVVDGGF